VSLLSRSTGRSLALLAGGVALGLGVAVGASALTGSENTPTTFGRSATGDSASLLDADRVAEVQGPRTRADSPQAAVEQFLAAEAASDHDASFALLADDVRLEYGTAEAWAADHPDALPPVTGFALDGETTGGGGRAEVPTVTTYRSSLDPVVGLVPARARTRWVAVEEDGGWAVDVAATTQETVLPPEGDAVKAVQAWAEEQQRCGAPEQYEGGLRGRSDLAAALCGAKGALRATEVGPLSEIDAPPLQNSFGAEAVSWARTVALEGPVPLRAVVAPVDDRWLVIGMLAPRGGG
jgi:hypothetical protein